MLRGSWGTQKPPIGSVVNQGSSLARGLQANYLCNEGTGGYIRDSAHRNDGTLTNFNYTSTSGWVAGDRGPTLLLDGSNDGIPLQTATNLIFGTSDFSIAARIRPASVSAYQIFVGKDNPSIREWQFSVCLTAGGSNSAGYLCFFTGGGTNTVDSAGAVLTVNSWADCVVTRGQSVVSLYLNGILLNTKSGSPQNFGGSSAIYIGQREYAGFQQYFGGNIDRTTFWNRVLVPGEVSQLYSSPYAMIQPPAATKFYSYAGIATLIAFDAASNSGDQSAVSSVSMSVAWNGTNRMLAIDVPFMGAAGTVSSMTYGGATCTLVGARNVVGGTGRVEQWRICQNDSGAPAAGSNTLVVTYSGVIADTSVDCVSYTNVNQVSPTEAWNGNSGINAGSATDATVVVTSTTDNCWFHYAMASSQTSGMASSNTSRNIVTGAGGTGADADSNAVISPAGAQTGRWTGNGITSAWAVGGYAIKPFVAPTGNRRRRIIMGAA